MAGLLNPKVIIERVERLRGDRGNWEQHWQEIADHMVPRKDTIVKRRSPGEKRNTMLLDNTAMQSGQLLAAALHSMLTNPSRIFFGLTTGDEDIDDQDDVRIWLQDSTRRIHNVLNNSNFQTQIQELFQDVVYFGTAAMSVLEDELDVIRFNTRHISAFFIQENNRGVIDEIYLPQEWTAQNIVREFGMEAVSENVRVAAEKGVPTKFEIIQAIYPRDILNMKMPERFNWISQWVLRDDQERNLKVKGFREFPFVTPRWSKASGEQYGRSPGMVALPDAKTINRMDETMLIGAQKAIDPPLQLPDDGFVMPILTKPGGLNFFRSGTQDIIRPIFNDTRLDFGFQAMEERRGRIRKAFFIDELRLAQEGPQMTATEILQRAEDSARLLGPVLARFQKELLRPLVDRTFAIMLKRDMFKEIPEALQGRSLDVQFNSLIAKSQRIVEGQSIERFLGVLAPFISLQPTMVDNLDGDQIVRAAMRIHEPPQQIIKPKSEVEQIRQARVQEEVAAQQAAEESQAVDGAAKLAPGVAQLQQAQG